MLGISESQKVLSDNETSQASSEPTPVDAFTRTNRSDGSSEADNSQASSENGSDDGLI